MISFALLVWGLSFLVADAKIFGISTRLYKETLEQGQWLEAEELLKTEGVLKFRNKLLPVKVLRDFLGCYFCIGFWSGIVAHCLIQLISPTNHFISHSGTASGWAVGLFIAGVLGCVFSYLVDLAVGLLEKFQSS